MVRSQAYACGQCPLCLRTRTNEWVLRATHELETWKHKAQFLTLTYRPKELPRSGKTKPMNAYDKCGNLRPEDMTKFIKRLRKKVKQPIKYIYCGEYGDKKWRPHYHIVIYGFRLKSGNSKKNVFDGKGQKWWDELWTHGHVDVDDKPIHKHAIHYVLGYTRKKITNKYGGKKIYERNGRIPPYQRQSQGIGKDWALKNIDTWIQTLKTAKDNYQANIPRYYIKLVYKMEGTVIKRKIPKFYNDLTCENLWEYKIIKNLQGKYTNQILAKQEELKAEERKRRIEENKHYDLKDIIEFNKRESHEQKKLWKLWKTEHNIWKKFHGKTIEIAPKEIELNEHTKEERQEAKEKIAEINRKKHDKIRKKLKGFWAKAHEIAKYKNDMIRNGAYGDRGKYETLAEIYDTT